MPTVTVTAAGETAAADYSSAPYPALGFYPSRTHYPGSR